MFRHFIKRIFFLLLFFSIFLHATATLAWDPSSDFPPSFRNDIISDLKNIYNNYIVNPGIALIKKSDKTFTNIFSKTLPNVQTAAVVNSVPQNQVAEVPTQTPSNLPLVKGEMPKAEGIIAPPVVKVADSTLLSALKNLLSRPEIKLQLTGPAGPAGAPGIQGPKGDSGSNGGNANLIPAYIGVFQPNKAENFNGATTFGVTDLSSSNLTTNIAKATTLTVTENSTLKTLEVTGNSTITGNLTVTGTVTGTGATTGTSLTLSGGLTALTFNGLTITSSTGALTIANSKTLTASDSTTFATNSITLGGGEVITFSASNALSLLTTGATSVTLPTSGILYGTATDSITSLQLLTSITNETGTGALVFGTSPTFTTQIISPLVIGSTSTTGDLSLQTTSGIGATGADMHFLVGNNGATEAMTILNSGNVGIGTTSPQKKLHIASAGTNNAILLEDSVQAANLKYFDIVNASQSFRIRTLNDALTATELFRMDKTGRVTIGNGISAPISTLDVKGNATIGATYANTNAAPSNGLIVEGNVGIGTASPAQLVDIQKSQNAGTLLKILNTNGGTAALAGVTLGNTDAAGNYGTLELTGTGYTGVSSWQDSLILTSDSAISGGIKLRAAGGGIKLTALNTGAESPDLYVAISGLVGIGTTSPTGNLSVTQTATATGALKGIVYTGAVNTNQTLSTEIPSLTLTTAGRQWATGALTTQREVLITQPTYSFVGASTITDAATVGIAGAPIQSTNATLTNTHGLLIQAGAVSTATNSYGLTVNAQTGATNNYAAAFLGGNVGIGTAAPGSKLEVAGEVKISSEQLRVNLWKGVGGVTNDNWVRFQAAGTDFNVPDSTDYFIFTTAGSSEWMRIQNGLVGIGTAAPADLLHLTTGNLRIGASTAARATTAGTNQLILFDGTAPVGTLTNGISLYSTAGELRVMDAAGNATLLSPHENINNYWVFDSTNSATGKNLVVDMELMMKKINKEFGWDYIHETQDGVAVVDNSAGTGMLDVVLSGLKALGVEIKQSIVKLSNLTVDMLSSHQIYTKTIDTEELCVSNASGKTCITRTELDALLQNANINVNKNGSSPQSSVSSEVTNSIDSPSTETPADSPAHTEDTVTSEPESPTEPAPVIETTLPTSIGTPTEVGAEPPPLPESAPKSVP